MNGNKLAADTNIILYLLAGDETLPNFLQDKQVYISVITELELTGYPELTNAEQQAIKTFLHDCIIIELNEAIKSLYISLRKKYKLKLGDAVVAATAIYLDLPFITADKDFIKVTELQLTLYNR